MQQDSISPQTLPVSYRPRLFIKNGLFSQTLKASLRTAETLFNCFYSLLRFLTSDWLLGGGVFHVKINNLTQYRRHTSGGSGTFLIRIELQYCGKPSTHPPSFFSVYVWLCHPPTRTRSQDNRADRRASVNQGPWDLLEGGWGKLHRLLSK